MVTRVSHLLIKTRSLPEGSAFAAENVPLRMEPLFLHEAPAAGMGLAPEARWHIAEIPRTLGPGEAWDMCHHLRAGGMGFAAAAGVEFVEPDFQQRWEFEPPEATTGRAFAAQAPDPCAAPTPPVINPYTAPSPYDWRWFQGDAYTGLDSARARIDMAGIGTSRPRVMIAHLDTGYRKDHAVLPEFLDTALQRSFVKGDVDPAVAWDPAIGGLGNNPGHGTGTLSLLAGKTFNGAPFHVASGPVGGAPFARVIPVRVANSVVEFANSSIAQGIQYAIDCKVDVLSMSMGGIPSRAWAEAVNRAYDAGITLVTAAGNNYGPGKFRVPKFIVWPARFRRVIAVCGAMSDGTPWADFPAATTMGGSYGPDSKMDTAMAGFTPNVPWASYDCPALIRFDGTGTSAATPQVAAVAACYIQNNFEKLRSYDNGDRWMRVETVRKALFDSAAKRDRAHCGQGTPRVNEALNLAPSDAAALTRQKEDSVSVPFLGPIFGALFGVTQSPVAEAMLHLEAAQILASDGEIQQIFAVAAVDPDGEVPPAVRRQVVQLILASPAASQTLKKALGGTPAAAAIAPPSAADDEPGAGEMQAAPAPLTRNLRVFAFDPALGLRLDTQPLNETSLAIPWEADLQPGPVGEYIEVVDVDPATGVCYAPVNLNEPNILAAGGLAPSEAVPQFHQQMVYAVTMTTIGRFERALGRKALWSPHDPQQTAGAPYQRYYVQRLRVYPHALREANAYYSPVKKALLFGYFQANLTNAGDNLPGGVVFNCLSHDVVAHETTHALLDGLHPYYQFQTNPDLAAFHEAFADIVALFQHFSIPEALRQTVAKTRGDLGVQNLLADLAQQFGQASDGSRALRSGLGKPPSPTDYANATEAHARGAVLLAAIFEAFVELYKARSTDLKRLATGGTGVLPEGDIPVDLIARLCVEAAQTASRVLNACIRALDYCPPVDLNFGDYLRALITADLDLEPETGVDMRVAFLSAFRARGIYPGSVRSLSEESLRWQPPLFTFAPGELSGLIASLSLSWNLASDRRKAYEASEENGRKFREWLNALDPADAIALSKDLGVFLVKTDDMPAQVATRGDRPLVEMHSVRPARRIGSNGQQLTDLVIEMVQRYVETDPVTAQKTTYRGGCTMLIDLEQERIRYVIRKRVGNASRIADEQAYTGSAADGNSPYFGSINYQEPFAMLHRGVQ